MTDYFIGIGGNDSSDGLSWANRWATISKANSTATTAGDRVFIGPGRYTVSNLAVTASGSSGNPIEFIGDYSGANTDGTGGQVRFSQLATDIGTPSNGALKVQGDYRTFRGIYFTGYGGVFGAATLYIDNVDNFILEQCVLMGNRPDRYSIYLVGTCNDCTIRNNVLINSKGNGHILISAGPQTDAGHVIESNIIEGGQSYGVYANGVGGITVRNNVIQGYSAVVRANGLPAGYAPVSVTHNILDGNNILQASSLGEIVEDENSLQTGGGSTRINVATGANSDLARPVFDARPFFEAFAGGSLVLAGMDLSGDSPLVEVANVAAATAADLRGKSVVGSHRERGALEYDASHGVSTGGGGGAVLGSIGGRLVRGES